MILVTIHSLAHYLIHYFASHESQVYLCEYHWKERFTLTLNHYEKYWVYFNPSDKSIRRALNS